MEYQLRTYWSTLVEDDDGLLDGNLPDCGLDDQTPDDPAREHLSRRA